MTEEQVKSIMQSALAELKMVVKPGEVDAAMNTLEEVLSILTSEYHSKMTPFGVILLTNQLPVRHKVFPDILRVLANMLEIKIKIDNKEIK